jgi:hypothetical protein
MPKLVSPDKSSFVPGRQIVDNIIMTQEVIHSMHSMKVKKKRSHDYQGGLGEGI